MTQINEHLRGVGFTPSKLRVTELREELSARGMSPKGLKHELVDRLSEAVKSEGSQSQATQEEAHTQEPQTQEVLQGGSQSMHDFEVIEKDADVDLNPLDNQQPQPAEKTSTVRKESEDRTKEESREEDVDFGEKMTETKTQSLGEKRKLVEQQGINHITEDQGIKPDEALGLSPPAKAAKVVSDQPATAFLHITNLSRPFTVPGLKDVLSKHGTFDDFWIDNIKSHAYVHYSTTEQATTAKDALNGLHWPSDNSKALSVDFVPDMKADISSINNSGDGESAAVENKTSKTLDDLFFKTRAEPQLYYLPSLIDDTNKPNS